MTGEVNPEALDRRVRRSRRAIREAFVDLVLEGGFGATTVEAIIQRADVSRATFYAHYRDIDELLLALVEELAADLVSHVEPLVPYQGPVAGVVVRTLCEHADGNREMYRVILSGAADGRARSTYAAALAAAAERIFVEMVASYGGSPVVDLAVAAKFWAGAYLAILEWWLCEEPERSMEDVAATAFLLTMRGLLWSLGLEGKVEVGDVVPGR